MTLKELRQIYFLNREVIMWQQKLETLRGKSLVPSPGVDEGHTSGTSDRTADSAIMAADIERIIQGKITEIQLQRQKIMEYIMTVDDSLMRQILFLRHVSLMTWRQVAANIGASVTEESVKKTHQRFWKK